MGKSAFDLNMYLQKMQEYINNGQAFEVSFVQELKDFGDNTRAKFIYYRCIRHNHLKWARAIKQKYHFKEDQHDIVIAMGHALMAQKQMKNK